MQMSDACYSPSGSGIPTQQILHVMPKTLVSIPTFVQTGKGDSPTFLPLDSVLQNLSSRPDNPVSFSYSHGSQEKTAKRKAVLTTLMNGANGKKEDFGSGIDETEDFASPYAVVGDKYAEFVRSGAIKPIMGKLTYLTAGEESENKQVSIRSLSYLMERQLTQMNIAGKRSDVCESDRKLGR